MSRKTKIIATIGPATIDLPICSNLIAAGVDYIRINSSYGDEQQYDQILHNLKQIGNTKIKILFDIKKLSDLDYCIKHTIDTIAVSFVETTEQIKQVREKLPHACIVSKIETEKGVAYFDEILTASDGIMVARGDLSTAVFIEKVPPLQKDFTRKTIAQGKFLVTATEMLLSMVDNPKPTNAEVSDVANAVFDGSSAVMLSEETAIGKHPILCVEYMDRIIIEAENWKKKHVETA